MAALAQHCRPRVVSSFTMDDFLRLCRPAAFTFVDIFCGAGGSITGMIQAGGVLVAGANHWTKAIETVDANHGATGADLLCVDINNYDMRNLPRADVLWASVLCTEASPAGGKKKARGQLAMDLEEQGHVPNAAFERTRACALDVVRATEIHRYKIVVVENVVEFARDWELFDWWIEGMRRLGYDAQIVCADSAHIGDDENPPAPQWRGRIYVVFNRKGVPKPDLELRPTSYCPSCDGLVEGRQWWKRTDRTLIGKYGPNGQYLYRCTVPGCSSVVEPLVLPAIHAIDLTDLGERIGDRERDLVASTKARIQWGIDNLWGPIVATVAGNTHERGSHRVWPADESPLMARTTTAEDAIVTPLVAPNRTNGRARGSDDEPMATVATATGGGQMLVNSNHDDVRVRLADAGPLPTATSKIGDAVVTPLVSAQRSNSRPAPADEQPLATVAAGGNHLELTSAPESAFYVKAYAGNAHPRHLARDIAVHPLGSVTTKDHHHLVIPYRRGKAKTTGEPLHTLATRESAALVRPAIDINDCYYRMLQPAEHARAQRFPIGYVMKGNKGEQTMLAGNAVSCNAGFWIGCGIATALS